MRPDRMTSKSQEAFRDGLELAARRGNPEVYPEHILLATLEQEGGVAGPLLQKAGADLSQLTAAVERRLEGFPKVSGGAEPGLSRRLLEMARRAEDEAKSLKDDFVSVEHYVLAMARHDREVQALFEQAGRVNYDRLLTALASVRGSQRVVDRDPEGKFQALDKYTRDLTDAARRGKS
ncbi:MAG TPA: Clp protease N-terminal domain-containing protein, partial [Polyangiaceae bacterium]|nr:Clp protease N-terminal domain-containing protein [Polyangiaceae bacterium]